MINTSMKILDIINEDADVGSTMSANIADVAFPLFGKEKMIRRAVDPKGYITPKKKKSSVGYVHPVNESIHEFNPEEPMNPTIAVQGYGVLSLKGAQNMIVRELKELAQRAERGEMENVQYLLKNAPMMSKIDAVVTALEELEQRRKRGGSNSRGIEKR